jgi:hypothetical protein
VAKRHERRWLDDAARVIGILARLAGLVELLRKIV